MTCKLCDPRSDLLKKIDRETGLLDVHLYRGSAEQRAEARAKLADLIQARAWLFGAPMDRAEADRRAELATFDPQALFHSEPTAPIEAFMTRHGIKLKL